MKYSYSFDEESFFGEFDTPEDAESAAQSEAEDNEDGDYTGAWIAENRPAREMLSAARIGDNIFESISETLYDEISEAAEYFTLTAEQQKALGQAVIDWIENGPGFKCYGVKNIRLVEFSK